MTTFSDVVGALNNGVTHETLGQEMRRVVEAVRHTRKNGELVLKLKISPNGERGVTITEDIKTKVPELARGASVFFADADNNLLRRNPEQTELFREVTDPETGEVKTTRVA